MKNILLVIAVFFLTGMLPAATAVPTISKETLKVRLDSSDVVILDARAEAHWDASEFKIPGAFRAPAEQVEIWSRYFPKGKTLVVYCACHGLGTSGTVARQLMAKGFAHVYALTGGWREWYENAYPIQEK